MNKIFIEDKRKKLRRTRLALAVGAALALGVAWQYISHRERREGVPTANTGQSLSLLAAGSGAPKWDYSPPPTAPRPLVLTSSGQTPTWVSPTNSVASEVHRLSRSPKVADKYAAYGLVKKCVEMRAVVAQGNSDLEGMADESCGDLNGEINTRLDNLRPAALAGLPGAWIALQLEAPGGGYGSGLMTEAEFQRIEPLARAAALANGDHVVLNALSQTVQDPVEKLKLTVEARDSVHDQFGAALPPLDISKDKTLAAMVKALPPDVATKAIADGHAMFATAQAHRSLQ